MKIGCTFGVISLLVSIYTESNAQNVAGYWLGVTYPTNPNQKIFNYSMDLTQTGTTLGGTAQTANPNVPFAGVAYVTGRVSGTTVTFSEADKNGKTDTQKELCYWRGQMTYNAADESLIGTYENITNQTTCTEEGSGKVELYRIVLKSGTKFCKGTPINLTVTGKDIRWYSSAAKTSLLGRGNTFNPSITKTTTFYITQTLYKNESPTIPITIEVVEPNFTARSNNSGCDKASGSIEVTATGAAGWKYSLNNGTFQDAPSFAGLAPGSYTVVAKDVAGCQSSQLVTITTDAGPTITNLTSTPPRCATANGEVRVQTSGGKSPLTYSIDYGKTFQNNPVFSKLSGGSYTVRVRDANGCEVNRAFSLPNWQPMAVLGAYSTPTSCGKPNGEASMTMAGGTKPIRYSIDNQTFQTSERFTGLAGGNYTLVARDSTGCTVSQSVSVAASKGPQLVTVETTMEGCGLKNGSMSITPNPNSTVVEYAIDGQTFQRTESFSALTGGTYTLTMRDDNKCVLTQSVAIQVDCANLIHLPTAFSPNADQQNDGLTVRFGFPSLNVAAFTVYDRWGNVLYNRTNFSLTSGDALWDGQINGTSAPEGMYVYRLDCLFPDGSQTSYRQDVTVIR
ncbi:gliding motility-associated C-terminal domain-containing protein [Spirosoma sp. BT702]|uniref:Gliding motility-associated C-terminal domain-containing protein n=1 Tax=Spirosoma profusum TaxID=2771354 RepID=A0A927AQX2_9BACT|nr:gliding motility-associated C-terminal domain-containing protein [Spirosoma profusum]MBD2701383.1 gliding motility-associated C-terminal domain-containing protein [Spirosoma profusum]